MRIIALYILFREGVADEDRRRLYQHARLSISEQDTINNLIYLGVQVIKVCTRSSRAKHLSNADKTLLRTRSIVHADHA